MFLKYSLLKNTVYLRKLPSNNYLIVQAKLSILNHLLPPQMDCVIYLACSGKHIGWFTIINYQSLTSVTISLYLTRINMVFSHFCFPNVSTKFLHCFFTLENLQENFTWYQRKIPDRWDCHLFFFLFNKWNADFLFALYSWSANGEFRWYLLKFNLLNTNQLQAQYLQVKDRSLQNKKKSEEIISWLSLTQLILSGGAGTE